MIDKIIQLSTVYELLLQHFNSTDDVTVWLHTRNKLLNEQIPIDLIFDDRGYSLIYFIQNDLMGENDEH